MVPSDDDTFRPAMDAERKKLEKEKQKQEKQRVKAKFKYANDTADAANKLKGNTAHTYEMKTEPRKGYLPRGIGPTGSEPARSKKAVTEMTGAEKAQEIASRKEKAQAYAVQQEQRERRKELGKNPKKNFTQVR